MEKYLLVLVKRTICCRFGTLGIQNIVLCTLTGMVVIRKNNMNVNQGVTAQLLSHLADVKSEEKSLVLTFILHYIANMET